MKEKSNEGILKYFAILRDGTKVILDKSKQKIIVENFKKQENTSEDQERNFLKEVHNVLDRQDRNKGTVVAVGEGGDDNA